jgi:hypothetical protein
LRLASQEERMRISFLKSRVVEGWRRHLDVADRYEAGETYDVTAAVAQHWIGRGAAVVAPADPAPEVMIPTDWTAGNADAVKRLAAAIAGSQVRTRTEAESIIRAEIDRRAASE